MVTQTFELVSYEKRNRVAWLTINNEAKHERAQYRGAERPLVRLRGSRQRR